VVHSGSPGSAVVFSLAGGVIICFVAIGMGVVFVFPTYQLAVFVGFGLLIVGGTQVLRVNPRRHVLWGTIVILSSVVSAWPSALWLYYYPPVGAVLLAGVALGTTGGVLWVRWKPRPSQF